MSGPRSFILPGALLTGWLLFSIPHGLTGLDLLAGLAAAGAGVFAAVLGPTLHRGAGRVLAAFEHLLGEAATPGLADGDGGEGEGDPELLDDHAASAAMDALLASVGESLGATRIVLWRVDRDADQVVPEHAAGPLPPATPAAGSPLAWALEERSPLRLDPLPRWARGTVVVVPVDAARVLTVETPVGAPPPGPPAAEPGPPADRLRHAAGALAPFLRLHDQQTHAVAASRRLDRAVEFLRSVPRENDPALMPAALARAAIEIAGGTGALVASWSGDEGQVLAGGGDGAGPAPGTGFQALDGDLAHAARTRATVRRGPGDGKWPKLASADERWDRPPPAYRTVVPLVDPRGEATGLLAVWGRTAPVPQGVSLLEAIAPLLALQLQQADDLARFRRRVDVDPLTGLPNRAALEDRMAEERSRFHRHRRPAALLVVDLDHFKRVNDSYGHDAGDAVLRRTAQVIHAAVRDVDFAARFGGEEIVVLLTETMLRPALEVAERVRRAVETTAVQVDDTGTTIPVTASIGVSACPECVEDPDALFASADQALYKAKNGGRNRVASAPVRVVSGGAGG